MPYIAKQVEMAHYKDYRRNTFNNAELKCCRLQLSFPHFWSSSVNFSFQDKDNKC